MNNNPTEWENDATDGVTKISFLNTRSLVNKFNNIKFDLNLRQSDLLVLGETWIPANEEKCKHFMLDNYEAHLTLSPMGGGRIPPPLVEFVNSSKFRLITMPR